MIRATNPRGVGGHEQRGPARSRPVPPGPSRSPLAASSLRTLPARGDTWRPFSAMASLAAGAKTSAAPPHDYLTEFEVFQFLRAQQADRARRLSQADSAGETPVFYAPTTTRAVRLEESVLQYLAHRPAAKQTAAGVQRFLQSQRAVLDGRGSAAQTLQLLNQVPKNDVELDLLLDEEVDADKKARLLALVQGTLT